MIKPLPHISTIKISSVTVGRVSAAGHPLNWLLAGALVLGTQSGMAAETRGDAGPGTKRHRGDFWRDAGAAPQPY